ncbi:hypothetical protein GCM10023084_28060 [Streptomyces lacrimifluminis]|uniref:Uncharacterized protein n=1 Tax=Streptomyces lacrimifluminis TaxID=1500077 RepID=A0A917KSE2_9ACTN|nr:hypothetical protein GCM10012282_24680 [Streptomyces lacrimifluminis]
MEADEADEADEVVEEDEAEREVKGDPSQGWPRHAHVGAEKVEGQPVATEMDLMNFWMRAAPIAMTVIGVTPPGRHSSALGLRRLSQKALSP